jgi:hypothetical protein
LPLFADARREVLDELLLGLYSFDSMDAANASVPAVSLISSASTDNFDVSGLADATREDLGAVAGREPACEPGRDAVPE